jgi:hypothetical protein
MTSTSVFATTALAAVLAFAACGEAAAPDGSDAADTAAETAAATTDSAELAGAPAEADEAPAETASAEDDAVAVDPEAYAGLFGDAADPEAMRGTFFVLPAAPPPMAERFPELPEGAIMIGAMWGDVAPWYLTPVSETRFEQTLVSDFQPEALVVEFDLDDDGNAVGLTFETMFEDYNPRARVGDVPEEWR